MKKALIIGLTALVLAACTKQDSNPANDLTMPVPETSKDVTKLEPPKADLFLDLPNLRKFEDPTVKAGELHYLIVRKDGNYSLVKIISEQKTKLVIEISDAEFNKKFALDLGDGSSYILSYNQITKDYQLEQYKP